MKKAKMNKFIIWGLLVNSLFIGIKRFITIPDFVACFAIGIGASLLVFGMYAANHDTRKFETWKRNLLKGLKIH